MTTPPEEKVTQSMEASSESTDSVNQSGLVDSDSVQTAPSIAFDPTARKRRKISPRLKVIGIIVLAIIAIYFSIDDESAQNVAQTDYEAQKAAFEQFDSRLAHCNNVMSAQPTEDFTLCLEAANEGKVAAQRRIIWAYSRGDEYQDWQQVFNHLKDIRGRDKNTQLLLYVILHVMGDTPELRKEGEQGIQRMVNRNYAPAQVLLASIYALDQNTLAKNSNILWLLERAHEQNINAIDPSKLALIYANGFFGQRSIQKATSLLKQAAKRAFPVGANNIAWFLSTIDDNPFTDSQYALELASEVVNDPEYNNNHIYVDTLAASYAANNMFNEAIETQQRAISLIANTNWNDTAKDREIKDFTERLNHYKKSQPLIEEQVNVDKETFFKELKTVTIDYLFNRLYTNISVPQAPSQTQLPSQQ